MKKTHLSVIFFILFLIFGTVIGVHIDALGDITSPLPMSLNSGEEVQEIADLRKANEDMKEKIKELRIKVEAYEEERTTENIVLKDLKTKVDEYRMLAGREMVEGPGIEILLESALEENIAYKVEEKKYLINLINELRMSGAEVISVNDHRLTSRTEVTLAGSHINVNTTAIAPPYNIKAIGDVEGFQRYVNYRTLLFDLMREDGINANVQFKEKISISSITKEKPMQFFEVVEGND